MTPDLGAMRAYVKYGIAIAISVLTKALPRAGTIMSYALERSNPAAYSEPRVGIIANSVNFLTCITSEFENEDIESDEENLNEEIINIKYVIFFI